MTLNSRFYDNRRTQEHNSGQSELVIFYSQRKEADISRCHHWFPRKMTAEIPYWWGVATQIWVVLLSGRVTREICFNQSEALPRSGSDTSTVWNIWSRLLRFLRSHFVGKQVGRPSTRKGRFRAPKTQVFKRALRVEIVENASFPFISGRTKTDGFDHTAQGMLAYFHRFSFFVWTAKTIQIRYVWTLIPLKRRKRF